MKYFDRKRKEINNSATMNELLDVLCKDVTNSGQYYKWLKKAFNRDFKGNLIKAKEHSIRLTDIDEDNYLNRE